MITESRENIFPVGYIVFKRSSGFRMQIEPRDPNASNSVFLADYFSIPILHQGHFDNFEQYNHALKIVAEANKRGSLDLKLLDSN